MFDIFLTLLNFNVMSVFFIFFYFECVYVILLGEVFLFLSPRSLSVDRVKDVFCQKNDEKNRSNICVHTRNEFGWSGCCAPIKMLWPTQRLFTS